MAYHVLGRVRGATQTWGPLLPPSEGSIHSSIGVSRRLGHLSVLSGPPLVLWVCLCEPQLTHWTLENLMVPLSEASD